MVENIVGIDLGTTQSCVSVWLPEWQRVEVISNEQGNRTTPSCVAFTDQERLIGAPAINQVNKNPKNTILQVKRLMGREFLEEPVQKRRKLCPFIIQKGEKGEPQIQAEWKGQLRKFRAEEISAMILQKMKEVAETKLGKGKVKNVVVTVPAYFNDQQRQATKDAGKIAGLDVVRILNEPTAAAFAYGLNETVKLTNGKKTVLVFDLGGGTFDVTILEIVNKEFKVKATGGDTNLGGEDFDDVLVEHCIKEFKKLHNQDISKNLRSVRRLRTQCEKAKRDLSFETRTTIEIDTLFDGIDFSLALSRARLENLLLDFFQKCLEIVENVIKDAKLKKQDIDDVLLVGGSSRIPKIQEMLSELFQGKNLCKSINPDEAVAQGAAGALLSGNGGKAIEGLVIQDVVPISLGIVKVEQQMLQIIHKNSPIPCSKEQVLSTVYDNQISLLLDIYQGERPLIKDNKLLAKFSLRGLNPAPKNTNKALVRFQVDYDGILTVCAHELGNENNKNQIVLSREQLSLEQHEIDEMLRAAEMYRTEDEEQRQRIVKKLEFEDTLYQLEKCGAEQKMVDGEYEWLSQNKNATREQLEEKLETLKQLLDTLKNQD